MAAYEDEERAAMQAEACTSAEFAALQDAKTKGGFEGCEHDHFADRKLCTQCAAPKAKPARAPVDSTPETAAGDPGVSTALIRRFLEIGEDEYLELCAFVHGRPWVCGVRTFAEQVRALKEAEQISGYAGSYILANGPIDPALAYRYTPRQWTPARNGRATDRDIQALRSLCLDVDPIRPKGISSTDAELEAARKVAWELREWLGGKLGFASTGFGCSGNGFFVLIAIEPTAPSPELTQQIGRFLRLMEAKFGTELVKIDSSVSNPARLIPAPGTWKRKGIDHPERPHRRTTFSCTGTVRRVPIAEVIS